VDIPSRNRGSSTRLTSGVGFGTNRFYPYRREVFRYIVTVTYRPHKNLLKVFCLKTISTLKPMNMLLFEDNRYHYYLRIVLSIRKQSQLQSM